MGINKVLNDFLKENDFDCGAEYVAESDSYYDMIEEHIVLGGQSVLRGDEIFIEYCKKLGLEKEYSINTLSFMHELGHHITLDEADDEDWEYARLLDIAVLLEPDNDEKYLKYFTQPIEAMATEWAVEFMNEHSKMMEIFDAALCRELEI